MTLINEEPEGRKTTKVLLAKMSAGALMAFCELLDDFNQRRTRGPQNH
nr:MAG TPA: hypothetical protein [Caudoviricetes sp.]